MLLFKEIVYISLKYCDTTPLKQNKNNLSSNYKDSLLPLAESTRSQREQSLHWNTFIIITQLYYNRIVIFTRQ